MSGYCPMCGEYHEMTTAGCCKPSRQVRVETQKPDAVDAHNAGFAAGRAAGLREAREAVEEKRKLFEHGAPLSVNEKIAFDAIDAALRALEVKP